MKKTLVALAALAATGAFAQSVNLYGALDMGYSTVQYDLAGVKQLARSGYAMGAHDTSRWGLTGSDDLGGGMKAEFKIESQIGQHPRAGLGGSSVTSAGGASINNLTFTNGTPEKGNGYSLDATVIGNRELWTAVKFATGTRVQVGYGTTALRNLAVQTDAAQSNQFGNQIAHIVGAFRRSGLRIDQAFGDVTASVGVFGNSQDTLGNGDNDVRVAKGSTVNVQYTSGPINAGVGYDSARTTASVYGNVAVGAVLAAGTGFGLPAATTAADATVKTTFFGGSYDLGAAKLYGQYFDQKVNGEGAFANTTKNRGGFKGTSIGARIPVGALTPFVQYYSGKNTVALGTSGGVLTDENRKVKGPSFGVRYDLSKRTYAYVNTGSLKTEASNPTFSAPVGEIKFKQTSAGLVAYF